MYTYGGPTESEYWLEFSAPDHRPLVPGVYTRAQSVFSYVAGRPGIEIDGDARGCEPSGNFEVRDLALDAAGKVTRAWAIFEQHCRGDSGGAVRGGADRRAGWCGAGGPLAGALARAQDFGAKARDVAVWVTPPAGGSLTGVEVSNGYVLRENPCVGATAKCRVVVGFAPGGPGTHVGALRVSDSRRRGHRGATRGLRVRRTDRPAQQREHDRSGRRTLPGERRAGRRWKSTSATGASCSCARAWRRRSFPAPTPTRPATGVTSTPAWRTARYTGRFTINELRFSATGEVRGLSIESVGCNANLHDRVPGG